MKLVNIVGVIVVVLAIEFLGAVFTGRQGGNLGSFGFGIAVTIAALALFIAVRHWTEDKAGKLPNDGAKPTAPPPLSNGLPLPSSIADGIERFVGDN